MNKGIRIGFAIAAVSCMCFVIACITAMRDGVNGPCTMAVIHAAMLGMVIGLCIMNHYSK